MKSYQKNPYQTILETRVLSHRQKGGESFLLLEDTLCYPDETLKKEEATINGLPVVRYEADKDGLFHIVKGSCKAIKVQMTLDRDIHRQNLRERTLRLFFRHALSLYYNRRDLRFFPGKMVISDTFKDTDLPDILTQSARRIIRSGLTLRKNENRTQIFGIGHLPYEGPHLINSAEVGDFVITDCFTENGSTILTYILR